MAETNLAKFKKLLSELFMLDQAELDFGIYRIMNAKREEITRFLNNDLLPQVKGELETLSTGDRAQAEAEYREALEQAKRFGVAGPENAPPVVEARMKLEASVGVAAMESEVFSHLFNFFRRYYSEGDFLSLRRYKEGVYAIPYEGEEVKLYWANADQYYIKTSENFRDYIFKLSDERRVHFKLIAADTEQNNNKAAEGQERRFILSEREPLVEETGELLIRFEYRTDAEKRKQADLNAEAVRQILSNERFAWTEALRAKAPTEKNPSRTLLEKHLTDYTSRNTFDYFIHKDLGGFLRRELDFYIKNEVMHLDDIESEAAPRVEQYLCKVKAIRHIAHKIIAFLEQLENFEKKLWLKKKFVVETNYCVTLDRVPEDLYAEIVANAAQVEEWVRLFAINEMAGNRLIIKDFPPPPAFCVPLTIEFLKANPFLILDTKFFGQKFKDRLLASFENLDEQIDGLLIHSENFQALNLLQERYREQIKCIYIDPPYNTGGDGFLYKDYYKHSSWATMMRDRLNVAHPLLREKGVTFVSIDHNERTYLQTLLDEAFGISNRVEELIWVQNTTHNDSPTYSTNHEYVEVYAKNRSLVEKDKAMLREPKSGYIEIMEVVEKLNPLYPPILEIEQALKDLMSQHLMEFKDELQEMGLEYNEETKKLDPWKGIYNYSNVDYRDAQGQFVSEKEACAQEAKIWVWRESDSSMPAGKQAESTKDPSHENFRFYQPIHPITHKPCPHPKRGWVWPYETLTSRQSFKALDEDHRIVYGANENKIPQVKSFLHETETNVSKSVIHDYTDGEKELTNIAGATNTFPNPKPTTLISRFILQTCNSNEIIMDFFVGSGATGQALLNLNRLDRGNRKYIFVEAEEYFDTVFKPRIQKVIYSKDWRGGKPISREGSSHIFKYIRLESYEDTLNNIELKRTEEQASLLEAHDEFREDYMLRYMLDVEASGSASLLNCENFADPFNYQLNVATGAGVGETRPFTVDLVETFNYLLGLRVKYVDTIHGFRVVEGTNPEAEKVLIIWRNTREKSNDDLDQFFQKQGYNTRDRKFDLIYTNGDNNLENLKRADETWKVRLIEEEFQRLMFDVQDV